MMVGSIIGPTTDLDLINCFAFFARLLRLLCP